MTMVCVSRSVESLSEEVSGQVGKSLGPVSVGFYNGHWPMSAKVEDRRQHRFAVGVRRRD